MLKLEKAIDDVANLLKQTKQPLSMQQLEKLCPQCTIGNVRAAVWILVDAKQAKFVKFGTDNRITIC